MKVTMIGANWPVYWSRPFYGVAFILAFLSEVSQCSVCTRDREWNAT